MMTIKEHENGTSRCAEFMYRHRYNSYQYIINVQGDMVDVRPDMIEQIFNYVSNLYLMNVGKQIPDVLSLYTQMKQEDRENPHVVKCIHNNSILAKAIWFLRAPLQYGSQHLGIYGYTKDALLLYNELIPEEHEDLESLEQLRWCVNDINFRLLETDYDGQEINTPEDLEKWKEINNVTR
jgi:3-deoxy-manno-octulosonate cytidylyltransferase (CMP-KDO synthetase)